MTSLSEETIDISSQANEGVGARTHLDCWQGDLPDSGRRLRNGSDAHDRCRQ
jgi:hypothetical protein